MLNFDYLQLTLMIGPLQSCIPWSCKLRPSNRADECIAGVYMHWCCGVLQYQWQRHLHWITARK